MQGGADGAGEVAVPDGVRGGGVERALGLGAVERQEQQPDLVGEVAEGILASQRVLPRRALALGYAFRFPEAAEALRDLLG